MRTPRRPLLFVALAPLLALVVSAPGAGASKASAHWAARHITTVVQAGVMGPDAAAFRPDDPLTQGELYDALVTLGRSPAPPLDPSRPVTIRELNARLVNAVGAYPAARAIRQAAAAAGLKPTTMLGTETVARVLGLRFNHPQGAESLERLPTDPAPRAEAAYSFARVLSLAPQRVADLVAKTTQLTFPDLDELQATVLRRALRLVGYPYVFAGSSEKPQRLWSSTAPGGTIPAPGGFDCSGFVWRVYKLEPFAAAPGVGDVLKGRTSYAMSGEVPRAQRIAFDDLQPGDLLFFGPAGPRSRPSQVSHMGIFVGPGWFVHSSVGGVTLQPLEGWHAETFAWGRRPLAEAGFTA